MKKIRFIALALVLVLGSALFLACSPKEEIEVASNVIVVDGEGNTILDTAVLVKSTEPTVLIAITQACQDADIRIENDGNDVTSINGIEAVDEADYLYFWDCTVDKRPIDGKAVNAVLTNDKEHNIVYTYSKVKRVVTDDEGNVVKDTDTTAKK